MGNDGIPISLVVIIVAVILGALGLVGWITTTLISSSIAAGVAS